jgi:bacillithiol biosynthesis cysteine-adding enzyme BshC
MFGVEHISYKETNAFSRIVIDYLEDHPALQPFHAHRPSPEGIRAALEKRKEQHTDRETLVNVLRQQYAGIPSSRGVMENIEALREENAFTICTAHQPNLFSGPLYFIYKIVHAIRLAAYMQEQFPQERFIPVYYMGSEDADLEELNHINVRGKKYEWQTKQKGAVGRMTADAALVKLLEELGQQLGVEPHGNEVCRMLAECYAKGKTIQQATFELVDRLFNAYGLVVLIPDHADLKRQMLPVFEDDIFRQQPSAIVEDTSNRLSGQYNVQAHPREINLFYLKDDIRERIMRLGEGFCVHHTDITFTEQELGDELQDHPERFSPNVILRGLFQETILPNIAFIGGGGELAYWLQLKDLFSHYNTPFPVLVLRNSLVIVEKHQQALTSKLNLPLTGLFRPELQILDELIEREGRKPRLNGEVDELKQIYDQLKDLATSVDPTLNRHVEALKVRTVGHLLTLEKKMLRAERKKHEATQRQVARLRQQLFPNNGLQERVENFSSYYARWGSRFLEELYANSLALEQQFTIIRE